MRSIKYVLILLIIIPPVQDVHSQEKDKTKWTPEEIINIENVRSLSFSPDSKSVVWTRRKGSKEKDKFVTDIYMTRFDLQKDGMPRTIQMTNSDESDHSPIFSKDGEFIYFLSSREKGKKLWKISVFGGEATEVNEFKNGITNISWISSNSLAFISYDGKTLYDEENKKDDTKVIDDSVHWKIRKVYSYDLKSKQITRLTNTNYPVSTYTVSHNGKYLVTRLQMSPHYGVDGSPKPKTYLFDIENNTSKQIIKGYQQPGRFQFAGDDNGLYFSAETSSSPEWEGPGITELYFFKINSSTISKVNLDWEMGISGYQVTGTNIVVALSNKAVTTTVFYKKTSTTWEKEILDFGEKNDHISVIGVNESGTMLAYAYSTASKLPRWFTSSLEIGKRGILVTNEKEFVLLNKKLTKKPIAKSEIFYWKGALDEEVNGMLYYPENYEPGKKYPLVISIHGGPTGTDRDTWSERWSTYPQIFSQRGAFILKPNYHGSGNHSQEFVESIKGHYYDLEEVDVLNGIDALDKLGYIDRDKLGLMGWSNGAIIATMLTLRHPDMFKVVAPGAGDVNWTSDYGTCRFGVTFDQYYFGGAPWDDVDGKSYNETYIIKSPLFEIEKIKTPTIIFHGSEDRAVPRDQGWEYYRGLQQVGKAPVKFLWFPGQPHGLQKITHQLRKMKEELAWFDTYLFETYKPENTAFKKESPLAKAIEMNDWSIHDGQFGVWSDNTLFPEMVKMGTDTIQIGRFEVTNAQYAAFDNNYHYSLMETNFPITGLSQDKINSYIEWINQKSGKTYRLPNSAEGKNLHKKAYKVAPKENTVNYWAGFEITFDEVAILKEKIDSVKTSLIKESGSFSPLKLGKANVYDIGGNVAEYYLEGSRLKTYGYSAYDFVDPNDTRATPSNDHTGFRLILEK